MRRPGCDVFFAPEKRSTMVCSLCRTVMAEPNGQPKQRYRTCLDCKPKPDCMPASKITTVVSKRKFQRLRKKEKERRRRENEAAMDQQIAPANEALDVAMEAVNQAVEPMNQQPIPNGNIRAERLVSKLTHYMKNDELRIQTNKHGKTVVVWNRDVNAGRNIMYVGKCQMFRRKSLFTTDYIHFFH